MKRTKLNWVAEFGYLTCQTKIGLMGVYPIGEHFYWQCAAPGIAYEGSGLRDDLTQEQCVERAEQWYYDATHEYPDDGYVKAEPGQAVVPASALASAIRELRWLASSANLVSPGLWKEENSWTVSEFNNAIRAALEGE